MGKIVKRSADKGKTNASRKSISSSKRDAYEKQFVAAVTRLAEPLCTSEGMELVHLEYRREANGRVLRLYIDKPGGVKLDDCVGISRELSDILDARAEADEPYRLEVSSPGVERPLGKLEDFQRFSDRKAKIRTHAAIEGRKNFTGILKGIADHMVRMEIDGTIVSITHDNISRARLVADI
jgi:ribosome maturation factor RimP